MKAKHRIAMCNLAMGEHPWLWSCDTTDGSPTNCAVRRRPREDVLVMVVLGADRAMNKPERAKWRRPRKPGVVTVCVGRGGKTEDVHASYQADLAANLVVDPASFLLVTDEVNPVSSSQVRSEIAAIHRTSAHEAKRTLAGKLVEQGLLHDAVAAYILANEQDLYIHQDGERGMPSQ